MSGGPRRRRGKEIEGGTGQQSFVAAGVGKAAEERANSSRHPVIAEVIPTIQRVCLSLRDAAHGVRPVRAL